MCFQKLVQGYLSPVCRLDCPYACGSHGYIIVQAHSCCQNEDALADGNGLCFVPTELDTPSHRNRHLGQGRCVDPIALFMSPAEATESGEPSLSTSRCQNVCMHSETGEDAGDQLCIRPREDVQLLRLSLLLPPWEAQDGKSSKTVIWNGPKREVWEQGERSLSSPDVDAHSAQFFLEPSGHATAGSPSISPSGWSCSFCKKSPVIGVHAPC